MTGADNVVLETVKRGEADREGGPERTVVLRLFERYGGHARATLHIRGLHVHQLQSVNILEDTGESLQLEPWDDGETRVIIPFRGFEIKTIKLYCT